MCMQQVSAEHVPVHKINASTSQVRILEALSQLLGVLRRAQLVEEEKQTTIMHDACVYLYTVNPL